MQDVLCSWEQSAVLVVEMKVHLHQRLTSIQHGKYKRDRFYFAVDPFEITNINRLTKQNTEFAGTLTSNIFPPIEQKLVVRPDYSLGFVQEAPAEGYPIYNNRATYHNIVDLSNRGLRGDGILEYVASSSASNDFLFLPDEARGRTYDFTVSSASERRTLMPLCVWAFLKPGKRRLPWQSISLSKFSEGEGTEGPT